MREEPYRERIIDLYCKTKNGGKVAQILGITNYRVYKCLREKGFDIKPRGREKISFEKVRDLYEQGYSTSQIAKEFDLSPVSVWERLKRNGVRLRTQSEAFRTSIKIKRNLCSEQTFESLHRLVKSSDIYKKFRECILQDRGYRCEITGQRDVELEVHHIIPLFELLEGFVSQYGTVTNDVKQLYKNIEFYDPFWNECNVLVMRKEIYDLVHGRNGIKLKSLLNDLKCLKLYVDHLSRSEIKKIIKHLFEDIQNVQNGCLLV